MAKLGQRLADYGFDKKKLMRDICNSRTYQLSSRTNETNGADESCFSHSYVRRLRAEVLLDSISFVTGTTDRFPSSAVGTRASQLYGGNITNYFLTTFGRAQRKTVCSCEVNRVANLSQALHMVNGDTITQKIAASRFIPEMIESRNSPAEIISELYIRALSRKPSDSQIKRLTEIHESELRNDNRVPKEDLALIAKWIERGAPETAASAAIVSKRKTEMNPATVAMNKPAGEGAMPESLPPIELPKTLRAAAITALEASPWAPLIAVSGHECIRLYNSDNFQSVGDLAFPEGVVHVLKFSRSGELLLAGGGKGADLGRVVLFDVRSGKRLAEIGNEDDSVLAADISPDQTMVALGGPGKRVKCFSVATGKQIYQIKKHTDWITAIEFSPNGKYLLSGDRNGGAFVWEAVSCGIVYTLGEHKEMITQVSWRADSELMATASEDGRVILWFAEDGFPVRTVSTQANANNPEINPRQKVPGVLAVRYAMNGDFATVGRDSSVRIWSDTGARNDATLEGFKQLPTRVCFSHDGKLMVTGDLSGTIRI